MKLKLQSRRTSELLLEYYITLVGSVSLRGDIQLFTLQIQDQRFGLNQPDSLVSRYLSCTLICFIVNPLRWANLRNHSKNHC